MPKDENLQKHTLNLFAGDMEKLQGYYPDVGASVVIRKIVRAYLDQIEAQPEEPQAEVEIKI